MYVDAFKIDCILNIIWTFCLWSKKKQKRNIKTDLRYTRLNVLKYIKRYTVSLIFLIAFHCIYLVYFYLNTCATT